MAKPTAGSALFEQAQRALLLSLFRGWLLAAGRCSGLSRLLFSLLALAAGFLPLAFWLLQLWLQASSQQLSWPLVLALLPFNSYLLAAGFLAATFSLRVS